MSSELSTYINRKSDPQLKQFATNPSCRCMPNYLVSILATPLGGEDVTAGSEDRAEKLSVYCQVTPGGDQLGWKEGEEAVVPVEVFGLLWCVRARLAWC